MRRWSAILVMLGAAAASASPSDPFAPGLEPGGMWPASPGGIDSARLVPSLSMAGALRLGYWQARGDAIGVGSLGAADRGAFGQVQLALGLLDWIEIGGSIGGRLHLSTAPADGSTSSAIEAAPLPGRVQLKLAVPGLRAPPGGAGTAAAIALDLRLPLGERDDRLVWHPSLLVEHRAPWGLGGALQLGVALRAADDATGRPLGAAIDLGLGGSLMLVERWALGLIASGRAQLPLAPLAAGAAAVPWAASGGLTLGGPDEGFFRLEAGIASPGLTSDLSRAGYFASLTVVWTPGRAASVGRARAREILDEPPPADAAECDALSAATDSAIQAPPALPERAALPHDLLAAPPASLPPSTSRSRAPPVREPGRRPCLTPRQTDIYVDFFVKADYQLGRGTRPGTGFSSTLLHLTYADGAEIDVDFREIDENTVDTPTFRRQVHEARVGPGNRLFPARMNRRTTPRLWAEKHKALVTIDEETLGVIDLELTAVMTVLPVPAGGLRAAPELAGPKRVRAAGGGKAGGAKSTSASGPTGVAKATSAPSPTASGTTATGAPKPAGGPPASAAPATPARPSASQRLANLRNGQKYDAAHRFDYPRREVYIDGPGGKRYRLDGYVPGREIISRKITQLARIKLETALRYVREIPKKYLPGRFLSKVPSNGPHGGGRLEGKMYLEVPVQLEPVPRAVIDEATELKVTIRDVMGKEYH